MGIGALFGVLFLLTGNRDWVSRQPAAVQADRNGSYRVPQEVPFLHSATTELTTVRVVVATDAAVLSDAVHNIPILSTRTGVWGQCPGPWSYGPVEIQLN